MAALWTHTNEHLGFTNPEPFTVSQIAKYLCFTPQTMNQGVYKIVTFMPIIFCEVAC